MANLFYSLTAKESSCSILAKKGLKSIRDACRLSEVQFLNRDILDIEMTDGYISEWPDFIYEDGVPLVSERVKEILDNEGVDYLFFKKIILGQKSKGIKELYWLALPYKIRCLDYNKSFIENNSVQKMVINPVKIGRYNIFKISNIDNSKIIITDKIVYKIKNYQRDYMLDNSFSFSPIYKF